MINQVAILNWLIIGILGVVLLVLVVWVFLFIVGAIGARRNFRKMNERHEALRERVDAEFARGSRLTNHQFSAVKTNRSRYSADVSHSGGEFTLGGTTLGGDSYSSSSDSSDSGGCND